MPVTQSGEEKAKKLRRALQIAIASTNVIGMPLLFVYIMVILGAVSSHFSVDFERDPAFIPVSFFLLLSISGSLGLIHLFFIIKKTSPIEEFLRNSGSKDEKNLEESAFDALDVSESLPYHTMFWSCIFYLLGTAPAVGMLNIFYCFPFRQLWALYMGVFAVGLLISVFQYYTARKVLVGFQKELLEKFPKLLLKDMDKRRSRIEVSLLIKTMGAMCFLALVVVVSVSVAAFNSAHEGFKLQIGEFYIQHLTSEHKYIQMMIDDRDSGKMVEFFVDQMRLDERDQIYIVGPDQRPLSRRKIKPQMKKMMKIIMDDKNGSFLELRRPKIHSIAVNPEIQKDAELKGQLFYAVLWTVDGEFSVVYLPYKDSALFALIPSTRYENAISNMYFLVYGVVLIALLLAVLYAYYSAREITTTLTSLMESQKAMAEGDLSATVTVTARDELGIVARSTAMAIFGLRNLISKVEQAAKEMDAAADIISVKSQEVESGSSEQFEAVDSTSQSMDEMSTSVQNISESMQTLASSAEQSSASILEVQATVEEVGNSVENLSGAIGNSTSSIQEMSSSINEVADNVQYLTKRSGETMDSLREMERMIGKVTQGTQETAAISDILTDDAEQGSKAVEKTIIGIQNIQAAADSASKVITQLGKRAKEIGNILTVIEDVTEETNLLALNAAIIAAQAGDHGRGFTVVADEIKDLAERTAVSTKEIAELIESVQEDSENAILKMKDGTESISEGVRVSEEAGTAIQKIQDSVGRAMDQTRTIAQAASVQGEKSDQVMEFMDSVNALVTQIAQATQEQTKSGELLAHTSSDMESIAQHVKRATQEQTLGSKQITQSIEHIAEITHYINSSQSEQLTATEHVRTSIHQIKDVAEGNKNRVDEMQLNVQNLKELSNGLKELLQEFKL